jgi:hypothetical protein
MPVMSRHISTLHDWSNAYAADGTRWTKVTDINVPVKYKCRNSMSRNEEKRINRRRKVGE